MWRGVILYPGFLPPHDIRINKILELAEKSAVLVIVKDDKNKINDIDILHVALNTSGIYLDDATLI